jgi:hypothetical protein
MALNKQNKSSTYLTIVGGKISQRVPEGTDGAVARKLKNGPNEGSEVYELQYGSVTGKITGGSVESGDYGDQVAIEISDGKESYVLKLPWNSKLRDAFVKRVPNIDVTEELEIICFPDKQDKSPVMLIKQKGGFVKFAYTKDNPNGLPAPSKKKVRGKEEWDWTETESFLWEVASSFFEQFEGDSTPEFQDSVDEEDLPSQFESVGASKGDDDEIPF